MKPKMMKRHEWWRENYRNARDLDHLSAEELSERFHDCVNNNRTRTERGKMGILPADQPVGQTWMILSTEILEECGLRNYPYPGPLTVGDRRATFDHAFDPIPDMERALDELNINTKAYLLKFGEQQWLSSSLKEGKFRIAAASHYDSDHLNHARRDSELERFVKLHPRNPLRSGLSERDSKPTEPRRPGWQSITAPSDYFLFSLAGRYSARLFGDFASTACLVIHEPREFLRRVTNAIRMQLVDWRVEITNVTYYDPIRVDPRTIDVPKCKPFKHAYQTEVRIICIPRKPIQRLSSFISIEIGSLEDCATLVDLSTYPSRPVPHDPTEDPIRSFGTINPESTLVNHLPNAAKMRGIVLNKTGASHTDWYFEVQYTDEADTWHQFKLPMLDGLYLLNLLEAVQEEQHLGLFNRK